MSHPPLKINAKLQIGRPADEVFQAIVNPEKMSNYFISQGSGPMEEGKTLTWHFPEFSEGFPVRIGKIKRDEFVSFHWGNEDGKELLVEIVLEAKGASTVVSVTEKSMENNEKGILWLARNTEGWANFLACLKAYLEYGINLRKGAFDFMRDKK